MRFRRVLLEVSLLAVLVGCGVPEQSPPASTPIVQVTSTSEPAPVITQATYQVFREFTVTRMCGGKFFQKTFMFSKIDLVMKEVVVTQVLGGNSVAIHPLQVGGEVQVPSTPCRAGKLVLKSFDASTATFDLYDLQ